MLQNRAAQAQRRVHHCDVREGDVGLASLAWAWQSSGMTTASNPYRGFRRPAEVSSKRSGCITASALAYAM